MNDRPQPRDLRIFPPLFPAPPTILSMFQSPVDYVVDTTQGPPTGIVPARLRGPAQPVDLAVVCNTNTPQNLPSTTPTVDVLLGNGDGTFQTGGSYPLPQCAAGYGGPYESGGIAAADLAGTGYPDLLAVNYAYLTPAASCYLELLRNSPAQPGTLQVPATYGPWTGFADIGGAMALGRFRGAAQPLDLAVTGYYGGPYPQGNFCVYVFPGDGAGGFGGPILGTDFLTAGSDLVGIAAGDFDGDGKDDLAVLSPSSSGIIDTVSILLSNGDGTFRASPCFTVPASQPTNWLLNIAVGRFRGPDQPLDLAVGYSDGEGTAGIYMLRGDGAGGFAQVGSYQLRGAYTLMCTAPMLTADLTGDGKLDLALLAYPYYDDGGQFNLMVLAGDGQGNFEPLDKVLPFHSVYTGGTFDDRSQMGAAAADFNGDGMPDIVFGTALDSNDDSSKVTVLLNRLGPCGQVFLSHRPASPGLPRGKVTFTAALAAGKPHYSNPQYQFWVYSYTLDRWGVAQDWSGDATLVVDTTHAPAGKYKLVVLFTAAGAGGTLYWVSSPDYQLV